jgi:transposase-like protein
LTELLFDVVKEVYVQRVSARKIDDRVTAVRVDTGMPEFEANPICAAFDEKMDAFRTESMSQSGLPYLPSNTNYIKARVAVQQASGAFIVATRVICDRTREVLDVSIGDSEDAAFSPSSRIRSRPAASPESAPSTLISN